MGPIGTKSYCLTQFQTFFSFKKTILKGMMMIIFVFLWLKVSIFSSLLVNSWMRVIIPLMPPGSKFLVFILRLKYDRAHNVKNDIYGYSESFIFILRLKYDRAHNVKRIE